GSVDNGSPPNISAAVQVQFGPPAARVDMPFFVRPFSVVDLSRLELVPAYTFPGSGPSAGGLSCGAFGGVDVLVNVGQFDDLVGTANTRPANSSFVTSEAPGLVNAPVLPD